jgi:hypothetical protein
MSKKKALIYALLVLSGRVPNASQEFLWAHNFFLSFLEKVTEEEFEKLRVYLTDDEWNDILFHLSNYYESLKRDRRSFFLRGLLQEADLAYIAGLILLEQSPPPPLPLTRGSHTYRGGLTPV